MVLARHCRHEKSAFLVAIKQSMHACFCILVDEHCVCKTCRLSLPRLDSGDSSWVQDGKAVQGQVQVCGNANTLNRKNDDA